MRQDVSGLRIEPAPAEIGPLTAGTAIQLKLYATLGSRGKTSTDLVMGNLAAWSSSNDKVADINRQGRLVPRAPGTVTITASYAGQTTQAVFAVVSAP
jgi:hypothetical protein